MPVNLLLVQALWSQQAYPEPMAWVEPEIWYRNLPTFYAATGILITDPFGRILLVKPNYRDYWAFPGGMIEANEAPHEAAARELTEELGLKLDIGNLLVVDWGAPMGERPSAIMYFLFDGGTIESGDAINLDAKEIELVGFFQLDECRSLLPAYTAGRAAAAVSARQTGHVAYLPG